MAGFASRPRAETSWRICRRSLPTPFDLLRPREQAAVLHQLVAAHPALDHELAQLALAYLEDVNADQVAQRVTERLASLPVTALAARAGKQPGCYVHETDAACQLVEEALEPFEDDPWRCVGLRVNDAAKRQLVGLLEGLYRGRNPDAGSVLAYAGPDLPHEHATWLIDSAIESVSTSTWTLSNSDARDGSYAIIYATRTDPPSLRSVLTTMERRHDYGPISVARDPRTRSKPGWTTLAGHPVTAESPIASSGPWACFIQDVNGMRQAGARFEGG
ncbi:MAG: hypothetical protein M3N28_04650 [Actinomycetota bacterium]|nr:hypothetical protein [Actinomycetota bacterium]